MSRYEITSCFRLCNNVVLPNNYSDDVEQIFQQVSKYEKMKALKKLLDENDRRSVLVFVKMNRSADFIAMTMSEQGHLATFIHGDRGWRAKKRARRDFRSGHIKILLATSAGICSPDIKNVDIVVNYDLPKCANEYVNRIGKIRRVGQKGKAISFLDIDDDSSYLNRVLRPAYLPSLNSFVVGSVATCQANDAMAVTPEISPAHQLQCPPSSSLLSNGARELLKTSHIPKINWFICPECTYYSA